MRFCADYLQPKVYRYKHIITVDITYTFLDYLWAYGRALPTPITSTPKIKDLPLKLRGSV